MNSPKHINYEIRPYKFTERKMLLASLQRICNFFKGDYQYIGMGGLAFTDFKLFHKELHIKELTSIEGGNFSAERLEFNSPYSFIDIIRTNTTSALSKINLTKKSLIWLDYDGTLDTYMFEDITLIFNKIPEGSIYIVTCNKELKNPESGEEHTTDSFKNIFGSLTPFDIKNSDFSSENNHGTIRKMLGDHINRLIGERNDREEDNLEFHQLFNILYQENRGARMYTFGGLVTNENIKMEDLDLDAFDFIVNNDKPYHIKIPNLTRKEIELIDKYLYKNEEELISKKIVSEVEIEKYKKAYKYVPHFYDIRI